MGGRHIVALGCRVQKAIYMVILFPWANNHVARQMLYLPSQSEPPERRKRTILITHLEQASSLKIKKDEIACSERRKNETWSQASLAYDR